MRSGRLSMRSWCGRNSRGAPPPGPRKSRLAPPGPELLALERELADDLFEYGHADARLGRNAHRSVWLHSEGLADDLCREVARRRRDVTGQTEVRQRREMHVVRTADAHLEHPAAPHGHLMRGADVVNPLRRGKPADPPGLDVHGPGCADRDRLSRVLAGVDRLVEADGRRDLALERRVVDEIVVRERLLDHHRTYRIDPLEKLDVAERIRRVRIEHEGQIGESLAGRLRDLDLEARLDLELHALVSTLELAADRVHERFDRWLDADGDAAEDPIARPAEKCGMRLSRALGEDVPDAHLDGRFPHAVLADPSELFVDVLGRGQIRLKELRQDELLERVEDGAWRFARVPRDLASDALAPPDRALRLHATEHPRHVCLARSARFVRALQRKPQDEQLDPLQPHGVADAPRGPCACAPATPRFGCGTRRYAHLPLADRRNSTARSEERRVGKEC